MKSLRFSFIAAVCLICSSNSIFIPAPPPNNIPVPVSPTNNAVDVVEMPEFVWSGNGSNYTLEIYKCEPTANGVAEFNLANYSVMDLNPSNNNERFKRIAGIADDLSGITYCKSRNTLFGVTNKDPRWIMEMDLNGDLQRLGSIVNGDPNFDPEDIEWIKTENNEHHFLIVDEQTNSVYYANVPVAGNLNVNLSNAHKITLSGTLNDNEELEGVSIDRRRNTILVAKEYNPSRVSELEFPQTFNDATVNAIESQTYDLEALELCDPVPDQEDSPFDISGLHHLSQHLFSLQMGIANRFLMITHEKEKIYETDMDGTIYSVKNFCETDEFGIVDDFKLEGITMDENGIIYLVAEPNIFYKLENPNLDLGPLDLTSPPVFTFNATSSPFTLPQNLDQGGQYCWRVIDNETGISSDYSSFTVAVPDCLQKDRDVLEAIYLSGDGSSLDWDLSAPTVSGWDGISVDTDGCVTEIQLIPYFAGLNFGGTIPSNIGDMEKLKVLKMALVNMNGTLPLSMSTMTSLEYIDISGFNITGTITTQFDNKPNLEVIGLSLTSLTGTIPSSFQSLTSLKSLTLVVNNFSGTIWDKIYGLPNLEHLDVLSSGFSGGISSQVNTIPNLKRVRLNANNFTGNLPVELVDLTNLQYFEIGGTNFTGSLDPALLPLCGVVVNAQYGNNFTPSWDSFCGGARAATDDIEFGFAERSSVISCSTDSLALVDLYNSLNGATWNNPWDLSQPVSTWFGITLDANKKVMHIALPNQNISGTISSTIGCLNELVTLDFSFNQIEEEIPLELGQLIQLERLNLKYNNLSGSIPKELGDLSKLMQLDLFSNELSDIIPWQLQRLTNLENLSLGRNNLGGAIPNMFDSLTNLVTIDFSQNNFVGNIPETIYTISVLTDLNLNSNQLIGNISSRIAGLSSLSYLNFGRNQLTGTIPSEIASLVNLEILSLAYNELEGQIPAELTTLSNLTYLLLNYNKFSGEIPVEFGNHETLNALWLKNNRLSGTIPEGLASLPNLFSFNASYNQLSGCYPDELINLCSIVSLNGYMSNGNSFGASWAEFCTNQTNSCSSPISTSAACPSDSLALISLYNATNGASWQNPWHTNLPLAEWFGVELHPDGCVKSIHLPYNNLDGYLPQLLGSLSTVERIDLGNNTLNSTIPEDIGQLTTLNTLRLESNNLSGTLPVSFSALQSLENFSVANNNLVGSIDIIVNWTNAEVISMFNNNFGASVPDGLTNLNSLTSLWLSYNNFTGCYNPEFATLCGQLLNSTNEAISDGNQFASDWESFCSNGLGVCCLDNIIVEDMMYSGVYQADKEVKAMGHVPSNHHPVLRASETIELDSGFEVEQGGLMTVSLVGCQ